MASTRVEHLVEVILGHDNHTIFISHHDVAWIYRDPVFQSPTHQYRNLPGRHPPPADGLGRSSVASHDRQGKLFDEGAIPNASIHNRAGYASGLHGRGQQVAKAADPADIAAGPNRHHAFRHEINGFELGAVPSCVPAERFALDSVGGPCKTAIPFAHEDQAVVHNLWQETQGVEDIGNCGRPSLDQTA